MQRAIAAILEHRRRQVAASSRVRLIGSLAVHLLLAATFTVAPLLAARKAVAPPEFVPVYVVPAQALGVREPVPAPRRERRPEPEPVVVEESAPKPTPAAVAPPEPRPKQPAKPAEPSRERPAAPEPAAPDAGELGRRQGSPTGSSTGTSAFGGASIDLADQNFTYGYYLDQMLSLIGSQWSRPRLGATVRAAVFFRIQRDGSVSDLRIVESSGFNVFDLAGLRAVQLAGPFPRLPDSYPQGSLAVKLYLE